MMAASVVGKGITGKHTESSPAISPSPHSSSLHEPVIAKPSKLDLYFTISATKSIINPSKVMKSEEDSSEGVFEANDQLSSLSSAGKQLALSSTQGREASPVPNIVVNEEETNIALSQLKELDLAISARKGSKIDGRKTRWIEYRRKLSKHKPKKKVIRKKNKDILLSVDINENSSIKSSGKNALLMEDFSKEDVENEISDEEELQSFINNNNNKKINNNNNKSSSKISEAIARESTMKAEAPTDASCPSGTTNVLETMKQQFLQGTVNAPDNINNGIKEKPHSKKQQSSVNGSSAASNEMSKRKRGRPKKEKNSPHEKTEVKNESTNSEIKNESTNIETNVTDMKSIASSPLSNTSLTSVVNGNGSDIQKTDISFQAASISQATADFYRRNYLTKGLREVRKSESGSESGMSSPEKSGSTPLPVSPISHSPPNWNNDVNSSGPTKCPLISAAAKMLSAGNKKLGTTYGIVARKKKIMKKLSKKENIHKKENICTNLKANGNANNHDRSINKKNISLKGLIGKSSNSGKVDFLQTKRGRGRPKTKVDSPNLKWTKKTSTVIADVHNTMNGEPQTVISTNNSVVQKKRKTSLSRKASESEFGQLGNIIEDDRLSNFKGFNDTIVSSKISHVNNNDFKPIVPNVQLPSSSTNTTNSLPIQSSQDVSVNHSASKFNLSSNLSKIESTKPNPDSLSKPKENKISKELNLIAPAPASYGLDKEPLGENEIVTTELKGLKSIRSPGNKNSASTIIVSTAEAIKINPVERKQNIALNDIESVGYASSKLKQKETSSEKDEGKLLDESNKETRALEVIPLNQKINNTSKLSIERRDSPTGSIVPNSSANNKKLEQKPVNSIVTTANVVPAIGEGQQILANTAKSISERLPTSTVVTMSSKFKVPKKTIISGLNKGMSTGVFSPTTGDVNPRPIVGKSPKKSQEKLKSKSIDAVIEKLHSPISKKAEFANNSLSSINATKNLEKSFENRDIRSVTTSNKQSSNNKVIEPSNSISLQVNEKKVDAADSSLVNGKLSKQSISSTNNIEKLIAKPVDKKVIKPILPNNSTLEKKVINRELPNGNSGKLPSTETKVIKLNRTNTTINSPIEKKVVHKGISINGPIAERSVGNVKKIAKQNAISPIIAVNFLSNDKKSNNNNNNITTVNTIASKITLNENKDTKHNCEIIPNDKKTLKPNNNSNVDSEKDTRNEINVPKQTKMPVINSENLAKTNSLNNSNSVSEKTILPTTKPKEKVPRFLKQLFQDEGVQNMLRSVNEEAVSGVDGSPGVDGSSHKLRPKRANENFSSESQDFDEAYYTSNAKRKRKTEVDNLYSDEGALNMLTSLDNSHKKAYVQDDAAGDTVQDSCLKNLKVKKVSSEIALNDQNRKRRLSGTAGVAVASQSQEPKKQKLEERADSGLDASLPLANSESQRIAPLSQSALLEKRKPGRPSLPVALKKKNKLQLQFQLKKQLQRLNIASDNLTITQMKEMLNKIKVKETYQNKPVTIVPPLKIKLTAQVSEKPKNVQPNVEYSATSSKQVAVENESAYKPPYRIFKTLAAAYNQGSNDGPRTVQPSKISNEKHVLQNSLLKRISQVSNNYRGSNQAPLPSLLRPLDAPQGQKPKNKSTQEGIRHSQRASVRHTEGGHYRDIALRRFNNFMQIILTPSTTKMKNALNTRVLRELCDALNLLRRDESVRMVLLTSTGSTFCQGIDLTSLQHANVDTRKKNAENLTKGIKDFLRALAQFPKMLVAGVNGNAMGLGVTMLPLFDVVYASDKAEFYLPYSKLGQVPEGGATYTFPYYYGKLQSNKMFYGQKLTASQAQQMGLVSESIWPDTFFQEVIPKVAMLATQSAQSMEGTKALVNHHITTKLELSVESECRLLKLHWASQSFTTLCKRFIETSDIQLQKPVNLPL